MSSPCQNCPDRKLMCHAECKKYKTYQNDRKAISEIRLRNYGIETYFDVSIHRSIKLAGGR
jgi:hypothetical protein